MSVTGFLPSSAATQTILAGNSRKLSFLLLVTRRCHKKRKGSRKEPRNSKVHLPLSESCSWDIDPTQTEFLTKEEECCPELKAQWLPFCVCKQWQLAGAGICSGLAVSMPGVPGSSQALQREENCSWIIQRPMAILVDPRWPSCTALSHSILLGTASGL